MSEFMKAVVTEALERNRPKRDGPTVGGATEREPIGPGSTASTAGAGSELAAATAALRLRNVRRVVMAFSLEWRVVQAAINRAVLWSGRMLPVPHAPAKGN